MYVKAIHITCDFGCGTTLLTHTASKEEANDLAEIHGWISQKATPPASTMASVLVASSNIMIHVCPDCAKS